jgi:adenosylcobinamide kinase/adenosylcobinamide-phosphate guanylyltransferase
MERKIIFVTGGARSGKSSFALADASGVPGKRAFIATALQSDDEMRSRIERHKRDRGDAYDTYEEPLKIGELLKDIEDRYEVIILDCLTLWLANLMLENADLDRATETLVDSIVTLRRPGRIYVVSNEVGMGIVPADEMSRRYRDAAGFLNQRIAEVAHEVYMTVSGIPVKIKESGGP